MRRLSALLLFLGACASNESSLRDSRTGALEHEMANCPSSVRGANTAIGLTSDGADVTITSVVPYAQLQIKELAERHARMGPPGNAHMHTGGHGGPGMMGHCPIIHHGTIVTMTPVVDGAVIHIRATESSEVGAIQRDVQDRAAALQRRAENH